MGTRFDPHIHEAVVSESTDEYEPDTVMQEIIRGYRLGDKLIRPAHGKGGCEEVNCVDEVNEWEKQSE